MTHTISPSPDQARRDAQQILSGGNFHHTTSTGPRPLHGVLHWIGDRLAPVGRAVASVWRNTVGRLPPVFALLILVALIAAGIALLATNIQSRAAARQRLLDPDENALANASVISADQLEAEANIAEQTGAHALAVRLRFRAGLLRLDHEANAIAHRPGLTTQEVRTALRSGRFDHLADEFEAVAYGSAAADENDSTEARREWPIVVREASRG